MEGIFNLLLSNERIFTFPQSSIIILSGFFFLSFIHHKNMEMIERENDESNLSQPPRLPPGTYGLISHNPGQDRKEEEIGV